MTTLRNLKRRDVLLNAAIAGIVSALPRLSQAQQPKKGGRLRVGIAGGATSDTVDPAIMDSAFTIPIAYTAFNHLTETDSSGRLVPELAEEWEAIGSPIEWTFKLRRHVQFHNGKTMSAEDVVASINYHRGEGSKSVAKAVVRLLVGGPRIGRLDIHQRLFSECSMERYLLEKRSLQQLAGSISCREQ